MLILGLSSSGQNPAACILRGGKLIAFAEEERFVRIKTAPGLFPEHAVRYCLSEAKVSIDAVEWVAVGWDATKYRYKMPLFFLRFWWRYCRKSSGDSIATVIKMFAAQQPAVIRQRIGWGLGRCGVVKKIPTISFVPHHLAHAASTYYASGFTEAAVLVVDGSGEERATSVFYGSGTSLEERFHIDIPHSLGWFYAAMASYLGFMPYQEDGFLMGLAPYGKKNQAIFEKLHQIVCLDSSRVYRVDPRYALLGRHDTAEHFSNELVALLGPYRNPGAPIDNRHRDITYATQAILEEAVIALARKANNNGTIRNLCLAGGVALNCKANGAIARSGLVDDLFVQPAAHDSGSALGAAMVVATEFGDDPRFRMEHAQWGPSFRPDEIRKALDNSGLPYTFVDTIEEKAATAIAAGRVVGWFDGRMEVGPRALGGRSILANPTLADMGKQINTRVKHRDVWRPLCPSMTVAAARQLLDAPLTRASAFMTIAHPVKPEKRNSIPAVVHIDGTTRPQVVKGNGRYARLLTSVGRHIGVEAVLNTSLNVKGEPIACTPADTLRCFFTTGIDAMALGNFWIEKKKRVLKD